MSFSENVPMDADYRICYQTHDKVESNSTKFNKTGDDIIVSVENVSKKFCRNLKRSMAYGIFDLTRDLIGKKTDTSQLREDEFWALRNINFTLRRGEILGLIGPNGCGKTTLLRMLSGIFPPDEGEISIRGRIGALIALGAGFHPHMSGRENIFLNGAILGIESRGLSESVDRIIDFSELEDFIDAPVSTYSSGMRVRLGFAIAAQMKPDILLIDEVLAVGDVGFKAKCYNAIADLSKRAAIIFVSHQLPQVSRVATKLLLLQKGKEVFCGTDVSKGINRYYELFNDDHCVVTGSGQAELIDLSLSSGDMGIGESIEYGSELTINLKFGIDKRIKYPAIYITFLNQSMQAEINLNSHFDKFRVYNHSGIIDVSLIIPELNLNPGIHYLSVGIQNFHPFKIIRQYYAYSKLIVYGDFVGIAPVQMKGKWFAN